MTTGTKRKIIHTLLLPITLIAFLCRSYSDGYADPVPSAKSSDPMAINMK